MSYSSSCEVCSSQKNILYTSHRLLERRRIHRIGIVDLYDTIFPFICGKEFLSEKLKSSVIDILSQLWLLKVGPEIIDWNLIDLLLKQIDFIHH